ncbi:GGDEF domain-containing protein [Aliiglaciecola sp.]|nr:GGDEF domain-containing protein [Aliiglaciecola sp.]
MTKKQQNFKTRISLKYVFTGAFAALFLVFVMLTSFSYFQLKNVKTALDSTSKESIPTIIAFDNIANKSAALVFYTEQLASALTPPALRLAQQQIDTEMKEISVLLSEASVDEIVLREFETIQFELTALSNLVNQRLNAKSNAAMAERQVYVLFTKAQQMLENKNRTDKQALTPWFNSFSRLIISTGSLAGYSQLNEIRNVRSDVEDIYTNIQAITNQLPAKLASDATAFNQRFSLIVLAESGFIDNRILQLRIEGRTNGRGNFTGKLVSDFARSLNFKSAVINEQILLNAQQEEKKISLQIRLLSVFFGISIVLFIIIVWLLRLRVINRLILLNRQVSREESATSKLTLATAEDEITDIAKTFETFLQTIEEQQKDLSLLAMQDGLTSIANRRSFDKQFVNNYKLAVRHNKPLSVLIIDVDYFKSYNDSYGHVKGDEALIEIANTLQKSMHRDVDFVARYGGEEFVCLLPSCNIEGALTIAENLRQAVLKLKIAHCQNPTGEYITISIGGATAMNFSELDITPDKLLEAADKALYTAKERGRNLVKIVSYGQ